MGLYDAAKDVLKIAQQMDNIEVQRALIGVANDAVRLQTEKQELRDKVSELERVRAFAEEIEFDGVSHIRTGSSTERFCTPCWESKRLGIHLLKSSNRLPTCPVCKWKYRHGVKAANEQRVG